MKFLLDTNVLIPLEPTRAGDLEPTTPAALELVRLARETGQDVYLHPASREDLARDTDEERRTLREVRLQQYPRLPDPPGMSPRVEGTLGVVDRTSNHHVDHLLLSAVDAEAVDCLITEDGQLRRKAVRLGLADRVLSLPDALATLRALFPSLPTPPPAVEATYAHALDSADPIFESFRSDYGAGVFDDWLTRCKRKHRHTWIVRREGAIAAFSIVKDEDEADVPGSLNGKVLKLCSFKVAEGSRGFRYGELLLKSVFGYALANAHDWVYVTVFPRHEQLTGLFEDFGFRTIDERSALGEIILVKPMAPSLEAAPADAVVYHRRFGPHHFRPRPDSTFVIPIQPRYHSLLFPEAETQGQLFQGQNAFGNSLRKAYLCNATTRAIEPGSVLLFYRSQQRQAITVVGVAEDTSVSRSPTEISVRVARRTVYSLEEIEELCRTGEVLAIRFRQARILATPVALEDLLQHEVLRAPPQSIVRLRDEGAEWVQGQIEA